MAQPLAWAAQDRGVELLQARTRVRSKLVGENAPGPFVDGQRLRPTVTADERKHQLRLEALAQRVLRGHGRQLGAQFAVESEAEFDVDAAFVGGHPLLAQVVCCHPHMIGIGGAVVGVRSPPQPQRRLVALTRLGEPALRLVVRGRVDQSDEFVGIKLVAGQRDAVATIRANDRSNAEVAAQMMDEDPQRPVLVVARVATPQGFHQRAVGDRLAAGGNEAGEYDLMLTSAGRHH